MSRTFIRGEAFVGLYVGSVSQCGALGALMWAGECLELGTKIKPHPPRYGPPGVGDSMAKDLAGWM